MKTSQWRRAVENRCVCIAHLKTLSDRSIASAAFCRHTWHFINLLIIIIIIIIIQLHVIAVDIPQQCCVVAKK